MEEDNWEELLDSSVVAKAAFVENRFRRELSSMILRWMEDNHVTREQLQSQANISPSQLARVLHEEVGGALHLSTIIRVCNVANYDVAITVEKWVKP